MLTAAESFRVLVALAAVGDADAFEAGLSAHRKEFGDCVAASFRGLGVRISQILRSYDYLKSPEFLRSIDGKSEQFVAMKRKLESDPTRRAHHAKRFEVALCNLPTSSEAYDLLSVDAHVHLNAIRRDAFGCGVQG